MTHHTERFDDPLGLPVDFGPVSNGEYDPEPLDAATLQAMSEARVECRDNADLMGMSRRRFLRSAAAMAVTLAALDRSVVASAATPVGGGYPIPPEARFEPAVAEAMFGRGDFVFDIQGHLLEYDLDPATRGRWFWGRQFPQAACAEEEDPRACFSMNHFLEEMFVRSDTTMVALSGLPILPEGSPLPLSVMEETRRVVAVWAGTGEWWSTRRRSRRSARRHR